MESLCLFLWHKIGGKVQIISNRQGNQKEEIQSKRFVAKYIIEAEELVNG